MSNNDAPPTEVTMVEDPGLTPLCPHCDTVLASVLARQLTTTGSTTSRFGRRYIYACPTCAKALGISHRKGFWMG